MAESEHNPMTIALAEAMAEYYFGNYRAALDHIKDVSFPPGSPLCIEALKVSYLANEELASQVQPTIFWKTF